MWPSEELASRIYDWANWGLVVGLVIGIIATVLVVWMGNVKETYLQRHLSETNEQSQKLEESNLTLAGNVAILQKDASEQQERAATAEKDLLELREKIKDRHLSDKQKTDLIAALKAGPKGSLILECLGGPPEICSFADEISHVLTSAGWTIKEFRRGVLMIGGTVTGFSVKVRSVEKQPQRAGFLQKTLVNAGLPTQGELMPGMAEDDVILIIGNKP